MYTSNLPDAVMIPDRLIRHVEDLLLRRVSVDELSDQAKRDAESWVVARLASDREVKELWRQQIVVNIDACKKYGIPECIELFTYVCKLIDAKW